MANLAEIHSPGSQIPDKRRALDSQASLAHDLMLALMDFAAAQAVSDAESLSALPTCQTCGYDTRRCVRGLYVRGLRRDFDDETEIDRLRGQGCDVKVVDASRLESFAPKLFGAIRRVMTPA